LRTRLRVEARGDGQREKRDSEYSAAHREVDVHVAAVQHIIYSGP